MIVSQSKTYTGAHLLDVLRYYRNSDTGNSWVLAVVVTKYRSSYRKPGALMLVDNSGKSAGLISGGCLEENIKLQARKVEFSKQPKCIVYDSMDEDNIAAELGLGCNGRVEIFLQPLSSAHRSILLTLLDRLENGLNSYLIQCFASDNSKDMLQAALLDERHTVLQRAVSTKLPQLSNLSETAHEIVVESNRKWSLNKYQPPINLWVFGGGIDARPLVYMASQLGWRVTLVDHRVAYGREKDFPSAEKIHRIKPEFCDLTIRADAAILMSHNLQLDADWLARLQGCHSLRYIGLLGPLDRKLQVMEKAGVHPDSDAGRILHGPMGFDIGGDLPESIALSVLAECHQVLFKEEYV